MTDTILNTLWWVEFVLIWVSSEKLLETNYTMYYFQMAFLRPTEDQSSFHTENIQLICQQLIYHQSNKVVTFLTLFYVSSFFKPGQKTPFLTPFLR